jgi:hypothetical protein
MELMQGHVYTFSTMLGTERHMSAPIVAGELEPLVGRPRASIVKSTA